MSENIDLKEIEKKAWTSYFQDGLLDILFGLILLSFAIIPLLEETGIPHVLNYIIAMGPGYVIFYAGKKYITIPRMGHVRFSTMRKSKRKKAIIVLAISVIFGFIVLILTSTKIIPQVANIPLYGIIFGMNSIIVFSLMAYFLDIDRFYIYGMFFAASIFLNELSRTYVGARFDNVIGFGAFGAIIVLIGIKYLIRFIQKYPLPSQEMPDASNQ